MFTGLIEELGKVKALTKEGSNLHIEVTCKTVLDDLKLGDSIALDGTCQTVVKLSPESFTVTAIEETLKLTNFNDYKPGSKINLERCLRLSDRLGGHIVQGHVDGLGEVLSVENRDGSYEVTIVFPEKLSRYIIHKGSITINGISLTVAEINQNKIKVCIIPKTWEMTNISDFKAGSKVNLEVDLLAKYVESLGLKQSI